MLLCGTCALNGENVPVVVEVRVENQQRYGIVTGLIEAAEFRAGLEVFGEVIDHGPLVQQWNDCRVAELAETAARKEYDRLVTLNEAGKFSSDHAVELAGSTLATAVLQSKVAATTLAVTWGVSPVGDDSAIDEALLKSLINRQSALVRVSLPPTQLLPPDAGEIWLAPPANPVQRCVLKWSWMDPKVSAQKSPGYLGVAGLEKRLWPVGMGLVGRVEISGEPIKGLLLPASAVVYQHGAAWAYQKIAAESFQQIQVDLSKPQDLGWFMTGEGVDAKLPVVVQGAQGILAQQLQAAAGAEDED